MTDNDIHYYQRRAIQARKLAHQAADSPARRAHQEMAARYEALASGQGTIVLATSIVERG